MLKCSPNTDSTLSLESRSRESLLNSDGQCDPSKTVGTGRLKFPRRLPAVVTLATLLVTAAGCGTDWKAEIKATGAWRGAYGGASGNNMTMVDVQGYGNETLDLPDDDRVCCVIQQLESGRLEVEIKDDGGGLFGIFASDGRSGATNVDGGEVSICTEGNPPPQY